MDFFNKIGKKASEVYDITAKKTGEIAKEAKMKMKINDDKSEINDLYKKIGEKIYQNHLKKEEIIIEKDFEEELSKIDILNDEIEIYLKNILELKDKKECPICHEKISKSDKFCPKCGSEQKDDEIKVELIENKKETTPNMSMVKKENNEIMCTDNNCNNDDSNDDDNKNNNDNDNSI